MPLSWVVLGGGGGLPWVTYTVLMTCASLISAFGLLTNSVPAVIGSMFVSPLSEASVQLGSGNFRAGLEYLVVGVSLAMIVGYIVAMMFERLKWNPQMSAISSWWDTTQGRIGAIAIALSAGVVLGVSDICPNVTAQIGVGIAGSILPPLVNGGLALAMGKSAWSSFILSLLNVLLIGVGYGGGVRLGVECQK